MSQEPGRNRPTEDRVPCRAMPLLPTGLVICKVVDKPDGPRGAVSLVRVCEEVVFTVGQPANALRASAWASLEGDTGTYPFSLTWHYPSGESYELSGLSMVIDSPGPIHRTEVKGLELPCPEDGVYHLELRVDASSIRSHGVLVRRINR
jgi:hypothetical protein